MAQRLKTDWILFTTVVLMVLFGALMIYSASSVVADIKMGKSYYYALRQVISIAVAVPLMMFMKRLNYRKLQTPAVAFTAMGLVMILLAVVYLADPKQHRWIRLGPVGVQPSEFTKPALALFLAYFIALRSRAINSRFTLLPAILALGFMTVAVALADLGTAIVLGATAAAVFIVAGLERRYILITCVIAVFGGAAFIAAKPYRLVRVISYVDPGMKLVDKFDKSGWIRTQMKKSITAKDTNYQAEQAKIAVGSGGPWGVGLMQGRQKLFYLPEAHTDTIYAVIGEEFGLFGSVAVLLGFVVILWRGIRATVLIPDEFGRYLALGITTMLVIQAFFNMTVVLGMMPTKGIPLPMISFGGSSLLVTLASLGILFESLGARGVNEDSPLFVMAGGGTGGHVIPAIAVAREVCRMGYRVLFVGTERGVENRLLPAAGFRLEKIRVGGIKNLGIATRVVSVWRLVAETLGQMARFSEWKPAAVFSMGGYVAGPPVLAALLRGVPVVVMEPNAVPGFTNRHIARWVKRALISFEETARFFPTGRTELTGLPVREEFFAVRQKREGEFTVLITGGSQGSKTLNEAARQSWALFRGAGLPVRFIHQTGSPMYDAIAAEFRQSGLAGEVAPFIADMAGAFAEADLVICRSGAGAVSELAAAGKPSVLIPFPFAADQHQLKNAEAFERAGAARMSVDRDWNGQRMFEIVRELSEDRARLAAMGECARKLAHSGAARRAAEILVQSGTGS